MKKLYIAPVQGHTDAAWRHFHQEVYGGNHKYYTPFMRCEHGEIRGKDLKDFSNELNANLTLEPQVIFRDSNELEILLKSLADAGAKTINLNMGCPFPLQTGKGRGAGFISNVKEAEKIPQLLAAYPFIDFSVKMRLGYDEADEWKQIIDILNSVKLTELFVHPRVAKQQYGGELHYDQFEEILKQSKNPVVFNGEIKTPDDIRKIEEKYPEIKGIMTARGILGRPSLAAEYDDGAEWNREQRIEKMMQFHRLLFRHYRETLCGDTQVITKIKPFWEYAETEIGRKAWKALKKASTLAKYNTAVTLVE